MGDRRGDTAASDGTMRAAALVRPGRIRLVTVPRPRPGRGEALVRVRAVGVCRSDLHYYAHGRIGSQVIRRWPQTLGHEPAGEVVALGPGVRRLRVGDRVAVEPAVPCGRCALCRAGRANLCRSTRFLGMPGQQGAFAEYLVMPERNLVRVPRSVSNAEAAALEPLAIGAHAVGLLGRRTVLRALVVGAGPVGLCTLAMLRLRRIPTVVCDLVPARLAAACKMGAVRAVRINPKDSAREAAARIGESPEAVFEAGGTPSAMRLAISAVRPGGIVFLIGICDDDLVPLNLHEARRKELTLQNVRRSNGELEQCVRLVASGRVKLKPMLTHQGDLGVTDRLFRLVDRRADGVIKAIVVP